MVEITFQMVPPLCHNQRKPTCSNYHWNNNDLKNLRQGTFIRSVCPKSYNAFDGLVRDKNQTSEMRNISDGSSPLSQSPLAVI